jgi:hypothetical protein
MMRSTGCALRDGWTGTPGTGPRVRLLDHIESGTVCRDASALWNRWIRSFQKVVWISRARWEQIHDLETAEFTRDHARRVPGDGRIVDEMIRGRRIQHRDGEVDISQILHTTVSGRRRSDPWP